MAATRARSAGSGYGPKTFSTGPWKGVLDTADPFDGTSDRLRDLLNAYIPDPEAGSGVYARNGFMLCNNGAALTTGFSPLFGQTIIRHTQLDGTILSFVIVAGKLLRVNAPLPGAMTIDDVSPVGISINTGVGPIYAVSVPAIVSGVPQSVLIINDGLSRPWMASDLTAPIVTGQYIDYDGLGSAWTAFGAPVVWQGAVVFVLNEVDGVARREDFAWTEPGQPLVGLQQTGFSNWMSSVKHATGPLFALSPTNVALYYFRANSIGAVSGDIGPNLASTATNDAIDAGVGTTSPQTLQQFNGSIFFCDNLGRPYRLTPGQKPTPIWHQMRRVTQDRGSNGNTQIALYGTSVIEPTLNLYLVAPWRADPSAAPTAGVSTIYVFDAATGAYEGKWTIGDNGTRGIGINALGVIEGADGNAPTLVVLGEKDVGSETLGFMWAFRIRGFPSPDPNQWYDDIFYPNVKVTTDRLGVDPDAMLNVDQVTMITGNASPCQVTVKAATTLGDLQGTPVPFDSEDESFRLVVGCDGAGRGPAVIVAPRPLDGTLDQWSLQRITMTASLSSMGPEDA